MTCQSCANWQPREHRPMAKQGYALCSKGKRFEFLSPWHTCEKHEATTAEIVAARQTMKGGTREATPAV